MSDSAKESDDSSTDKQIVEPFDAKWASTDIDAVWHFLGRFGKFQVIQQSLYIYIATTMAITVVSGMFAGKSVEFRCKVDNTSFPESANQSNEVSSCSVKTFNNWTSETQSINKVRNTTTMEGTRPGHTLQRDTLAQLPQILTMVGMFVGATSLPHLGDRFGRKKLLVGASICQFIVAILLAFVDSFGIFLLLKLLSGGIQQGVMVTIYNLELEVMTSELRPFVSFLQTSAWVVSLCITGTIGYFLQNFDWRDLQLAYALSFIPGFVCLWFMDESLRWLVINRRIKDVEELLQKACRMNNKNYAKLMETTFDANRKGDIELSALDDDVKVESLDETKHLNESFSFKILVVNKQMRKITLIICYTWMICSLLYYGLTLMSTSLAGDPYVNFFLVALAELPAGMYTFYTMKKFGRKKTIRYSNAVAGLALLLAVLISNLAPSSSGFNILLVVLSLIGKLAISGSFGTCWTYTPELFPTNLRNYGVGIASMAARLGASFSPLFTLLAQKAPWVPGTLFATVCFIGVFLMGPMPETRDRELPRTTRDVENWFIQDEKNVNGKKISYLSKKPQNCHHTEEWIDAAVSWDA